MAAPSNDEVNINPETTVCRENM